MNKKAIICGAVAGLVLTSIFLYSLLLNFNKPLDPNNTDASLGIFIMKYSLDAIVNLNFKDFTTLPMFYGFKNSLFFTNTMLSQVILSLPAYFITKNIVASIIAALIFSYNPYVSANLPDAMDLVTLQWMPLIFLFFERFLNNKKSREIFLFFLHFRLSPILIIFYIYPLFLVFTLSSGSIRKKYTFSAL